MPPHAAIPHLNLTDWNQLKSLVAEGARIDSEGVGIFSKCLGCAGVSLGSDLSQAEWSEAVDSGACPLFYFALHSTAL